jgi:hypothetical protein
MALGIYLQPTGYTPDKYDETNKRLDAAGAGTLEGMLYHFAMESDGTISVFDVWESEEAFNKFGETLMPVLAELGVDPGQPMMMRIHNIIKG